MVERSPLYLPLCVLCTPHGWSEPNPTTCNWRRRCCCCCCQEGQERGQEWRKASCQIGKVSCQTSQGLSIHFFKLTAMSNTTRTHDSLQHKRRNKLLPLTVKRRRRRLPRLLNRLFLSTRLPRVKRKVIENIISTRNETDKWCYSRHVWSYG